jgi:hypothetical protein
MSGAANARFCTLGRSPERDCAIYEGLSEWNGVEIRRGFG